jgi:hypothetical protein
LIDDGSTNGFRDDVDIAISAGKAPGPMKIVGTGDFAVPGVGFQLRRNIDFPATYSVAS